MLAVVLGGCAQIGVGDQAGCRTIYVYRPAIGDAPGGIQPASSCGGLPREAVAARALAMAAPQVETLADGEADETDETDETGEAGEAVAPRPVTPVSEAAVKTAPVYPPESYDGANEMLEAADMSAFMARVRADYAANKNSGAWGYVVIDALAGGDAVFAQEVLDEMGKHSDPEMLSAKHLQPWALAFAGQAQSAQSEMASLRRLMPAPTLLGHRALLAEGLGQPEVALAVYDEAPDVFDAPKPEDAASPGYLARVISFNGQRLLALRQAELLRALKRDAEAIDLLTRLLAAAPDDRYVMRQLDEAREGKNRTQLRTLPQAMALAISDEADVVEERQSIMALMVGRGAEPPFNHLLASMRQSALLLDPDNGSIRLSEVNQLYQHGHFEAALRFAQLGNPSGLERAGLASTAGLAALQLGSPETLLALTEQSLKIESDPAAKLSAAGALIQGDYTERALQLINQALRDGLPEEQRVFALLSRGQAHFQAGDVAGAVREAREAVALDSNENTRQFLASMLVKSPDRPEGLEIMRGMLLDTPGNVGLMNNLGYSLVDGAVSDAELDDGFRLLKEASRISPDEPNLLDSLGWAYYRYGDYREALRFTELAVEAYKPFDHYEIFDHLGDIHWRLEDPNAAREAWTRALEVRPPAHDKQRIEAKLASGLQETAPEGRDTPEVPLNRGRGEVTDI
jgi:tetratricopeptide (TPR) repeat protein